MGDYYQSVRVSTGAGSHRVVQEHTLVINRVMGKPLPAGACIHHVDHVKKNNANNNLVVCNDCGYHRLLHYREASLRATGSPNMSYCWVCKQWDHPDTMYIHKRFRFHQACYNAYQRERYAQRRSSS